MWIHQSTVDGKYHLVSAAVNTGKDYHMYTATILWRTIRTCLGASLGLKPATLCLMV